MLVLERRDERRNYGALLCALHRADAVWRRGACPRVGQDRIAWASPSRLVRGFGQSLRSSRHVASSENAPWLPERKQSRAAPVTRPICLSRHGRPGNDLSNRVRGKFRQSDHDRCSKTRCLWTMIANFRRERSEKAPRPALPAPHSVPNVGTHETPEQTFCRRNQAGPQRRKTAEAVDLG